MISPTPVFSNKDVDVDWISWWAHYTPEATFVQDAETSEQWSYQQAWWASQSLAFELQKRFGLQSGDHVAVLATNEIEYVFLFDALKRLGVAMVPINFRLTSREVGHILRDSQAKLLISQDSFNDVVREAIEQTSWTGQQMSFEQLRELARQEPPTLLSMPPGLDRTAMILYTSGTTGTPKGALITHQMMLWNSLSTGLRLNLSQSDVTVGFLPFFHTGGWNVLFTPFLHRGAKTILLKKFEPEQVLKICESEKVTILFGVPTTLDLLSRDESFATTNLSSVRFAVVGGEAMPLPLIRRWQERGIPIRQGYGLTEFGPNVFSLNAEDSLRKIGSVGFANPYIEVRLIGESGDEVPIGEVGELCLRGPACTPGYWQNEEATAQTLRGGWLHTGDLFRQDKDGYYYVVGRKKEMFISGGENVYPVEVEQFLRRHPSVLEAAVIGVPDHQWGEVGRAFIVKKAGAESLDEQSLRKHCLEGLAKFKTPKDFVFMEALPKGDSGKILKRELV